MTKQKVVIDLFYDIISPYSWVAFEALTRYKPKWGFDLVMKPVFLGGIMQASGNVGNVFVKGKGEYMWIDMHRLGKYYELPVVTPKDPAKAVLEDGSLPTMRFLTGLKMKHPDLMGIASRQLWIRRYNQDKSIVKDEDLMEICKAISLPNNEAGSLVAATKDQAIKDELKRSTAELTDLEAFGVPWIVVHKDGELHSFFGSDRFHLIGHLLGHPFPGPCNETAAKL